MRSTLTLSIFRNKASQANSRTAFAFDIDGVLKLGQVVLPEATAALKLLEKYNHPFILVTSELSELGAGKNRSLIISVDGGGVTEEERALKLSKEFKIQVRFLPLGSRRGTEGLIDYSIDVGTISYDIQITATTVSR